MVEVIDATAEATSQHKLLGQYGVSYYHVQFLKRNGEVKVVRNLLADNVLNAYLTPGANGRFAFYRYRQAWVLCGYRGSDRLIVLSPQDDPCIAWVNMARKRYMIITIIGAVLSLFLFGIPLLLLGLYLLVKQSVVKRPSEDEIRSAL